MKSVNVKEARLFQQWLHSPIANATWKDLVNFINNDVNIVTKAWKELDNSELYHTVGTDIENKAKEIVETKCKPEWDRISEEMKPLGEERNKLAKEKAELPEDWIWETEKEERLAEIDKKMSDLTNEYQKVTDDANAELNEYKDKRIEEEKWNAFFLEDDEYSLIWKYAWF